MHLIYFYRKAWKIFGYVLWNKNTVQFFFVDFFSKPLKTIYIKLECDVWIFGWKILQYTGKPVVSNTLNRTDAYKTAV